MKKKSKKKRNEFHWLDFARAIIFLTGKNKKKFLLLTSLLFVVQIYVVVPPFIIGKVVDFFNEIQTGDSLTPLYFYALLLGASFGIVAVIRLTIKKSLGNIYTDTVYNTRVMGFEELIERSIMEQKKGVVGADAQKIQRGAEAFFTFVKILDNRIYTVTAAALGVFVFFAFANPKYIVFLTIYFALFLILLKYFSKKIYKLSYLRNKAQEKASGSYIEGLNNTLTIKSMGAEKSFGRTIKAKENATRMREYSARETVIRQWKTYQVFNGIALGLFLLMIGLDAYSGAITVGAIVVYFGYMLQLTSGTDGILVTYKDAIDSKAAFERMMPIFWSNNRQIFGEGEYPKSWKTLRLNDASFSYKKTDERKVADIEGVDVKIKKGQKVGVVGKTGSGKSTIAKILVGLFQLDKGEYLIGKKDFYSLKRKEMFRNHSIVLQESETFNLSVRDNIVLMKKFDAKLFEKAIEISQFKDVIEKLPQKEDTVIGEKGHRLSGGEKQRLGIARAIYKNPKVLILDEATSSVDSRTEGKIQEAIERELRGKTLIFIAHRVSTLKNVDKIYVFEEGRIVEEGTYEELTTKEDSKFNKIYSGQLKKRRDRLS